MESTRYEQCAQAVLHAYVSTFTPPRVCPRGPKTNAMHPARADGPCSWLRWHPDKFAARFSHRLVDADRERVMERVSAISQEVKEQWGKWEEEET